MTAKEMALCAEIERLRKIASLADALCERVSEVSHATRGIFAEMYARGREYKGPHYGEELDALQAALSSYNAAKVK